MTKTRRRRTHYERIALGFGVLFLFAVVGVTYLQITKAAFYTANAQAEAGTRSGNTSLISTTAASGGSAVKFGGTVGVPAVTCDQAGIRQLVNSVSTTNITANLRQLVQDNSKPTPNELISRHVSSPGNKIKVDWAKQQLASYGLQVANQPFSSAGRTLHNVSGRLVGSNPNAVYVVGAHIDSISQNPGVLAPGADDDGAGIVAMMESARVLKGFQHCLKTSLDFNGYNDEEEELLGSPAYLRAMAGKTVRGAYNMDMIAYQPTSECLKSLTSPAAPTRDRLMSQKIIDMNTKYTVGLNVTGGTYVQNDGDDLEVFWDANIPGGYLIECTTEKDTSGYPHYHRTTDTMSKVNMSQVTKVSKLLVASLAELALQ